MQGFNRQRIVVGDGPEADTTEHSTQVLYEIAFHGSTERPFARITDTSGDYGL